MSLQKNVCSSKPAGTPLDSSPKESYCSRMSWTMKSRSRLVAWLAMSVIVACRPPVIALISSEALSPIGPIADS